MPLVELVLEMLCAAFPTLRLDLEAAEPREPKPRWEQPAPAADPGLACGLPAPGVDPALAPCYAALGVSPGADLQAVRAAWRALVREHHPDRHGADPERQRRGSDRVKELNRAFQEIKRSLAKGGRGPRGR